MDGDDAYKMYKGINCFVAEKANRRSKFIIALSLGIDIVGPQWLIDSHQAKKFLPASDYVLSHPESEREFDFNIKESIQRYFQGVQAIGPWCL